MTAQNLYYDQLAKSIADRSLFADLQLAIAPGECIVLSGDNGEGKSTLLRIMSGLLQPDRGQCRYNGSRHSWQAARRWLLHNVVYLHQEPYLFDSSVLDNIAYGLRQRGYRANNARRVALAALQDTDLAHLQQRSARQLSGGEKQRVALLRAWVLSPRLLLLDEPVASMDEQARHRTLFLIRRLLQDGVSLVITAHEPRFFAALASRHIRLKGGQLNPAEPLNPADTSGPIPQTTLPGERDEQHYRR